MVDDDSTVIQAQEEDAELNRVVRNLLIEELATPIHANSASKEEEEGGNGGLFIIISILLPLLVGFLI